MHAVMFDYDGVVSDSIEQLYAFYVHLCETHEKPMPFTDSRSFKRWFKEPYTEVYERLGFDWHVDAPMLEETFRAFRNEATPVLAHGILEAIDTLRARGFVLSIASNGFEDQIRTELESHGILDRFTSVRGIRNISDAIKPDPGLLMSAARDARIEPANAVYIGDSVSDIIAARAAGMRALGITTGLHSREDFEAYEPDAVLDHPEQIIRFIEKNGFGTDLSPRR